MATDTDDPSARPLADRPGQRPPLIIDLEAGLPDGERSSDAAVGEPASDPAEAAGSGFDTAPIEIEGATLSGPDAPAAADLRDPGQAPPPPEAASGVAAAELGRGRRAAPFGTLLAAAILGGAVAAGGLIGLDRAGYHPFPVAASEPVAAPEPDPRIDVLSDQIEALQSAAAAPAVDLAPLTERIAALKTEIARLAEAAPAPADGAAVQALDARVAKLEQAGPASAPAPAPAAAAPDPAVQARLDEIGRDLDVLKAAAAADQIIGQKVEDLASHLDENTARLGQVEARPIVDLTGVETAVKALQDQLPALAARVDRAPAEERVAALETASRAAAAQADLSAALGPAVAANALGAAVEAGAPFAAELSALRGLGLDEASLAPLVPQAARGLPTLAALRAAFDAAIAGIDLTTPVPPGAGPLDRLLGSARSLVSVRPANPAAGSDPASVVARIRAALADGDIAKALSERQALPAAAQAATADWAALAGARRDADALVLKLRSDALLRLGAERTPPDAPAEPATGG